MVLAVHGRYGNLEIYEPDAKLYWKLKPNQDATRKSANPFTSTRRERAGLSLTARIDSNYTHSVAGRFPDVRLGLGRGGDLFRATAG